MTEGEKALWVAAYASRISETTVEMSAEYASAVVDQLKGHAEMKYANITWHGLNTERYVRKVLGLRPKCPTCRVVTEDGGCCPTCKEYVLDDD